MCGLCRTTSVRKYLAWAMDLGIFKFYTMVLLGYFVFDYPHTWDQIVLYLKRKLIS